MSDSDVDLLPNNVFTFQNESTTVSARGPNINASNLTGLSFRNNIMTSTMNLPRNFERQNYMEQSYDQRSMYYRRDTSPPMSVHSSSSFRPRNYQHMHYPRGMSSQRSMINGRSGSPMSMRSMDSNATVSAADIAMAFKNMNFNKYDLKVIKDAYNQFMKRRMRKKIEKRRNLRLFLRGQRRKSGYDSGDLGSDSSISSDDCRSTRMSVYKDNMSTCRSTKTDFSDFRRTMREGNLYKDCSESFRQNTFKNMLSVAPRNTAVQNYNRAHNEPHLTQKDRFKTGFLLPSQRFNQSVASVPIPEKQRVQNIASNQTNVESHHNHIRDDSEMESEQEEIFSEITIKEKSVYTHRSKNTDPRKRCLEVEDIQSQNKRSKMSSPSKKSNIAAPLQKEVENISKSNNCDEFQFLKPQFPVRKSGHVKVTEKLLAKSAAPLIDKVISAKKLPKPQTPPPKCDQNNDNESIEQQSEIMQQSNSEISMRPSFIKRKLYTQKFDVLESKNLSSDNLGANSPQGIYSAIQKEKNKARKLVTNQSCLSRDVREDNNLMDLIHKIVPPDRMNVTNVTNKSEVANNTIKNKSDDGKWDITSVINSCNNDDVSDTYTDEEIFHNETSKKVNNDKIIKTTPKKNTANEKKVLNDKKPSSEDILSSEKKVTNVKKPECKILIEKLPANKLMNKVPVAAKKSIEVHENLRDKKDMNKGNIYNCVKSFWDTDFESDFEGGGPTNKKIQDKENINHGNLTLKSTNIPVNKTLDTSQSKFVWNNKSKHVVTLKSHSFSSQVKAVNVNNSFTKRTAENTREKQKVESIQPKEKPAKAPSKTAEKPKKEPSKKIILDTYNSTVSDNTQNETIINANIRSRTQRTKRNDNTNIKKKHQNDVSDSLLQDKSKSTTEKSPNDDLHAKQIDKKSVSKRTPASPKEFSCCKEPVNKKAKKELESKAKPNKTALDNYNSTLSDNTLDEIIKNGNRTRALRAARTKNKNNSQDDSLMLNMTLRSRQLDTSIAKDKNGKKAKVPKKAEEKARNTSNSSRTKETQSRPNKTLVTPVKGQKIISKNSGIRHSPRINNKTKTTQVVTPNRANKRK